MATAALAKPPLPGTCCCTPNGPFILRDVLHVPGAAEQLLSVRQATRRGLSFKFMADACKIWQDDQVLATAPCHGDSVYTLTGRAEQAHVARVSKESPQLWHQRFGHLGYDNLARLQTKDMLTGGIYKGSKSSKFALEAALNRYGVEEHIPGIYLGYS